MNCSILGNIASASFELLNRAFFTPAPIWLYISLNWSWVAIVPRVILLKIKPTASPKLACPIAFLALYSKSSLALARLRTESLNPCANALPISKPFSLNLACNPVRVAISPDVAVFKSLGSMFWSCSDDIPAFFKPCINKPFSASWSLAA